MAVGDIYRINVVGLLHGQQTVNTFHYYHDGAAIGDFSLGLVSAFRATMTPALAAVASAEFAFKECVAQRIWPLPVLQGYAESMTPVVGGVPGNSLPSSVAMVVTKRTALAGVRNRGRNYFAGVPTTFEDDSKVNALGMGPLTDLANTLAGVITVGAVGSFVPCIWHRGDRTYTQVTSGIARDILRNQRRRQVGRGA